MARTRESRPDSNEAIGARITLLRRAYSLAQGRNREMSGAEFARVCGIGTQALHNVENFHNRMGLDNAISVRARTGASLEFIYFGVRDLLPQGIATAIDTIEQQEKPRPAKRA